MKVILLRFGELFLKGQNKKLFESALIKDIKIKLSKFDYVFTKTQGRYVLSNIAKNDIDEIVEKLKKVFGLHSLSIADEIDANVVTIQSYVQSLTINNSFRISVKRADKKFPISSMDFARILGGIVLQNNPEANVDVNNPKTEISVDIRFNNKAYVYYEKIKCLGGLPFGTAGRGLLLLSGGIDSPVAGFMMAKRGLRFECLHFHSYPYTSEQAKEKVISLAKKLSEFCGNLKLHTVSFTEIQEEIHKKCSPEFMITIMRRIMMRVAEKICEENRLGAIITGESLGQVASQTMESMTTTNIVLKSKPVFRPCLGLDKEEIIKISKEIDAFETSILPYEDCCTVFLPKNPVIKPDVARCEREESALDINTLINNTLENKEVIFVDAE